MSEAMDRAHEGAILIMDPVTMVTAIIFFCIPYYHDAQLEQYDKDKSEALAGDSGGGGGHGH